MFLFVTASAIFNETPSITQKMLLAYVFLFTLHEWEENRFPGGFVKIMEGMIGKKFSEDAKELSHVPVIGLGLNSLMKMEYGVANLEVNIEVCRFQRK